MLRHIARLTRPVGALGSEARAIAASATSSSTGAVDATAPERTSHAGGAPWQTRAVHALACAIRGFGPAEWHERFSLARRWIDLPTRYLDLRAVHVLAVLEHWRATGFAGSAACATV